MVHYVALCKVKPEVTSVQVEEIMRQTRSRLLKIPEFRTVTCGKRIDPENEWGFFYAVDFENVEKMRQGQRTPIYKGYVREILIPYISEMLDMIYELDPEKNVKYS